MTRDSVDLTVIVDCRGRSTTAVAGSIRSIRRSTSADIIALVDSDQDSLLGRRLRADRGALTLIIDAATSEPRGALTVASDAIRSTFIAWVDGGSTVNRSALARAVSELDRFNADLLYADSIGSTGRPVRRPVPSPLRLRSQNYLGPLVVLRLSAVRAAGGLRAGFAGAELYDLSLRMSQLDASIVHLPETLTTVHAVGPAGERAEAIALEDHLARSGIQGAIAMGPGRHLVDYTVEGTPTVSVIIPTRGTVATIRGESRTLVTELVSDIARHPTACRVEFIIVADDATPQRVIDDLVCIPGIDLRLVRWTGPFNFSNKLNRGAAHAEGDFLILLNDDIEPITPGWIDTMVGLAQLPGVGLVGPLLFFEDGTIQHGGHVYRDSHAGHIAFGWDGEQDDELGSLHVDREVSGVTAACAAVRADLFHSVGGFSGVFPGNYNDVDFCLKIREQGLSIIWTPRASLYHFESKSRDARVATSEIGRLRERWLPRLQVDPYWPATRR